MQATGPTVMYIKRYNGRLFQMNFHVVVKALTQFSEPGFLIQCQTFKY